MDTRLKIASLNVRGMNNPIKRSAIHDWMCREDIDILCLQETVYPNTRSGMDLTVSKCLVLPFLWFQSFLWGCSAHTTASGFV